MCNIEPYLSGYEVQITEFYNVVPTLRLSTFIFQQVPNNPLSPTHIEINTYMYT